MPDSKVKVKVAYRKNRSSHNTEGTDTTCASTTQKTATIWQKVLILPKMLGRKSRKPTVAYRTTAVATMHKSRLNTSTVYFHGIFFTNESTRNNELSSSLSASGSRYCPSKRLLVQSARQQAVERVAQSRSDQKAERQSPIAVDNRDNDEGDEDQAQQGDLVWRRQELALHPRPPKEQVVVFGTICSRLVFSIAPLVLMEWQTRYLGRRGCPAIDSDGFAACWQPRCR